MNNQIRATYLNLWEMNKDDAKCRLVWTRDTSPLIKVAISNVNPTRDYRTWLRCMCDMGSLVLCTYVVFNIDYSIVDRVPIICIKTCQTCTCHSRIQFRSSPPPLPKQLTWLMKLEQGNWRCKSHVFATHVWRHIVCSYLGTSLRSLLCILQGLHRKNPNTTLECLNVIALFLTPCDT